jgi:hypothetical protein
MAQIIQFPSHHFLLLSLSNVDRSWINSLSKINTFGKNAALKVQEVKVLKFGVQVQMQRAKTTFQRDVHL